jgi:hypothetical protein
MLMKLDRFALSALAAAFAFASVPALAADAPPEGCQVGNITTVRVSKLKTPASRPAFEKAMADHAKWYADHGFASDQFVKAPVIVPDAVKKTLVQSPDQIMTLHTHSSYVAPEKRDAGWKAFVDEYRASSDMLSEVSVCMPN